MTADNKLLTTAIRLLLDFLIQDSETWSEEKWAKFEAVTGMNKSTLLGMTTRIH